MAKLTKDQHPEENTNPADQKAAFEAVYHAMKSGRDGGGLYITIFKHLYEHRHDLRPDGELSPDKVDRLRGKRSTEMINNLMHKLRKTVAYHSLALPASRCPCFILIDRGLYRPIFLRRAQSEGVRAYGLQELALLERTEQPGHLLKGSDVMIYIHQGDGIDPDLTMQMAENMSQGVRYKYYIPLQHLQYLPGLFAEICKPLAKQIEALLPVFSEQFTVNVVPHEFPFMFSIHNANKFEGVKLYVRTLTGARLIEYAVGEPARNRANAIKAMWPEMDRLSGELPIVMPCRDIVTMEAIPWKQLRIETERQLRMIGLPGTTIPKVIAALYPDANLNQPSM
ncbi:hypothetical protein QQ054_14935 [Oscillatoria amoena NRMC-F 0135]|nr:hypothetical protein [Oscillatoria amoena NRMC-F 0135]